MPTLIVNGTPRKLDALGYGSNSHVYVDPVTDEVIAFTTPTDRTKRVVCTLPRMKHIPHVTRLADSHGWEVYSMPLYRALQHLPESSPIYAQYRALSQALYSARHKARGESWNGYTVVDVSTALLNADTPDVPHSLKEAYAVIAEAMQAHFEEFDGGVLGCDFLIQNLAVDAEDNLILLDCFYYADASERNTKMQSHQLPKVIVGTLLATA